MPKRLAALIQGLCDDCISDVQGRMSGFYVTWSKPSDNDWEVWLVDVAPANVELVGGASDGERVFDPVHVDLLTLSQVLDSTSLLVYHPASYQGEGAHFVLEGKQGRREVAIRIWLEPFSDEEPGTVFDVSEGCWRPKRR